MDHLCYFCLVLLCFYARLFVDALWSPAGKGLTSWLSFVMSNCDVVTFPLVSWVRCGAWLYRFLIFVLFLTSVLRSWNGIIKWTFNFSLFYFATAFFCSWYYNRGILKNTELVQNILLEGLNWEKPICDNVFCIILNIILQLIYQFWRWLFKNVSYVKKTQLKSHYAGQPMVPRGRAT